MKNIRDLALLLFCAWALTACATLGDAVEEKGTGEHRLYQKPFDVVWDATVEVVAASKLDLVSKDKEQGQILAQKGMSAFSYGENVAVFVEGQGDSSQVEVVSKRALATNITAKNWSNYIFTELDKKLK